MGACLSRGRATAALVPLVAPLWSALATAAVPDSAHITISREDQLDSTLLRAMVRLSRPAPAPPQHQTTLDPEPDPLRAAAKVRRPRRCSRRAARCEPRGVSTAADKQFLRRIHESPMVLVCSSAPKSDPSARQSGLRTAATGGPCG